ncbi:unnamed protein product [Mytilus edulis]|uniref:Fibrinogen C-terminal domain-containing protein n=1 Tax=Mytilus edulis TaxID=6550 RepID=A0A8S3R7Z3_MYTED|nr:unnamed protein product [Mytilus edulis]
MNRLIIYFTVFIVLKGCRSAPTFMDNEGYGQTCASCSGVETSNECEHNTRCDHNEVCSMHYYVTESGKSLFDYGCAVPQTCLQGIGPIFGKRSEGHHVKCVVCCNDTIACNRNLICNQNGSQNSSFPRECSDIKGILKSGVYTIYPFGKPTPLISVFCEVDGNGNVWTDIQRRIDGTVDFFRNWTDYKNGFGNAQGEYWIGDSLTRHNGQKFTTDDRDNDPYGGWNCATHYHGAWWYEACHYSNLNGKYTLTSDCPYGTGIIWYTFHSSYYYCLKSTTMMIRRN